MAEASPPANNGNNGKKQILNGALLVPAGFVVALIFTGATLAVSFGDWRADEAREKAEMAADLKTLRDDFDRLEAVVKEMKDVDLKLVDLRQRQIEISLRIKGIME